MQLCIHTRGIDLTEAIKRQTYEKLDLALERLGDDIEKIQVSLTDTNGPLLGGIDKSCQIVVSLHQQDAIVVEGIDRHVDTVIDRTTDRLGVVACQRADANNKHRKRYRGYVDSDDVAEFYW